MLNAQVELHEGAANGVNSVTGSRDAQLVCTGDSQTTRALPPAVLLKARAFHSRARRRPAGAAIPQQVALHAPHCWATRQQVAWLNSYLACPGLVGALLRWVMRRGKGEKSEC